MENAVDALKMAGAVLLFVLALSIIILSFGQLRVATDTIIDYKDRETFYIDSSFYYEQADIEGNYGAIRTVNLETVIPSIFRAYLENYKIVFEGLHEPIYKIVQNDGTEIKKFALDLETNQNTEYQNVTLANDEQKSEFLCGILYHDFSSSGNQNGFEDKFNISLNSCDSLYDQLQGKTITEKLGVYYQNDDTITPDVNKVEKRIITYVINM